MMLKTIRSAFMVFIAMAVPQFVVAQDAVTPVLRDGVGTFADAVRVAPAGTSASPVEVFVVKDTKAPRVWTLKSDMFIHDQLAQWADMAGWKFVWLSDKGYMPPADATYTGSFDSAISQVIEQLFAEGRPVHLDLWEGNNVAEVSRSTPE